MQMCDCFICISRGLIFEASTKNVAYNNKSKTFLAHIHFFLYLCRVKCAKI